MTEWASEWMCRCCFFCLLLLFWPYLDLLGLPLVFLLGSGELARYTPPLAALPPPPLPLPSYFCHVPKRNMVSRLKSHCPFQICLHHNCSHVLIWVVFFLDWIWLAVMVFWKYICTLFLDDDVIIIFLEASSALVLVTYFWRHFLLLPARAYTTSPR